MSIKIHLDPGHYGSGYNHSPVNSVYTESNMTWQLTNYLKNELEKKGAEVSLSRVAKESNPSLYERGYGAKGCDLFLSIHSNASATESTDYPISMCLLDDVKYDFDNISREIGLELAEVIAETMHTSQKARIGTRQSANDRDKNGIKDDEYYGVLHGAKAARVPGIILEHSFHTNKRATEWLLKEENLKLLAEKEAEVIINYFNKQKKDSNIEEVKPSSVEQKLYRIRKDWADAASQIGAYKSLDSAKNACKKGYTVYDWNGVAVYSSTIVSEEKNVHIVKAGDTLNKIAAIYHTTTQEIMKYNNISNPNLIYIGQKINITSSTRKSDREIAEEVICGKWGNDTTRKNKLTEAGYDYNIIQKLVNEILK